MAAGLMLIPLIAVIPASAVGFIPAAIAAEDTPTGAVEVVAVGASSRGLRERSRGERSR
jgi:hypothetical protein